MRKKILMLLSVLLVFSYSFAAGITYTSSSNEQTELKLKTFLKDFITMQYKNTMRKDLSTNRVYDIIDGIIDASKIFKISPLMITAIIDTETNFRNIIGKMGEIGYMQIRPTTAKYIVDKYPESFEKAGYKTNDLNWIKKRLLIDPKYNILVGTAYLKHLLNYHDQNFYSAIGWYNGGGNEYYANKVIYKIAEITVTYPTI
ncbi:hypothetical protein OSSY52_09080 [Tepiditoga spiralis]|uniref:Transglycosylase SLT domain-containing protein n=1 Tax=Tepiditoga spiralis TaxID=2108365 RepID=A0A7G1G767_9BACT|nr:transglycosylase SLT domain-containing protein [Tepiditoga spiralis]BBE30767.1 hypothetical protein OSSY52_09080 [Tepiditoga spiralis]